jgi:hypothetical protein
MIDATTHTRKIWRSHFDGADSTIRGSCRDNLIHIFQNNFPVECHFQGPPNHQLSPIEFFKHFSDVYGSLFYTVVHR